VAAVHVRPLGFLAVQTPESQNGSVGAAVMQDASFAHAPKQSVPEQPMGQVSV
jgi:hypothetical protein